MALWVPVDSLGKKYLPTDRAYTELEAMFSLQCDAAEKKTVTVAGYANLWRWSRKKVNNFLARSGVKIEYPVKGKRNQRGHIRVHMRDIKGTNEGHIFSFINNNLNSNGDIRGTNEEHKRDIKGSTTNKSIDKEKIKNMPSSPKKTNGHEKFISDFNLIVGARYRGNSKTKRQYSARIKEGFTGTEIKTAIENAKQNKFLMGDNPIGKRYLTPEYITRADKLDEYLNQDVKQNNSGFSYPPSAEDIQRQMEIERENRSQEA